MKIKDLNLPSVTAEFYTPKVKGADPFIIVQGARKSISEITDPEDVLKLALWLIKAANELKKVKDKNAFNRD